MKLEIDFRFWMFSLIKIECNIFLLFHFSEIEYEAIWPFSHCQPHCYNSHIFWHWTRVKANIKFGERNLYRDVIFGGHILV